MKFAPAHGYLAKNSVGSIDPLSWLHAEQAATRLPAAWFPPFESGNT